MMKGAAENTLPMQVMPGQAGARQAPRSRMGADQLMADFEGLLARQSALRDMPAETTEDQAPDGQTAQPALSSPEALFLALAGGREFIAQHDEAERQPETEDSFAPEVPAQDESVPQPVTLLPEAPKLVAQVQAQAAVPQMPIVASEEKSAAKDKDKPVAMPNTARMEAPSLARMASEQVVDPAQYAVDDGKPQDRADALPSVEKKVYQIHGEGKDIEETGKSQSGPAPVTFIRVAGQETHFAPSPVLLFDDRKIDGLVLNAPAGPAEPGRPQQAPPPVVVKPPSGPLKTLKVELGSHELGLINATMALKDKALDLRIGAARDDAVASLRENAGRLSDTLQALGFSVDAVTVQKMHQSDAGTQTGSGQSMQQGAAGQDGSGQGQQRTLSGSGSGAGGSSGQSGRTPHDDHLVEREGNDKVKNAGGARSSRDVIL